MIETIDTDRVDFHIHYSDQNAEQIIEQARKNNVVALALIRRTEISENMENYINYGKALGVDVLPGVEYFARLDEGNVELIGLGFDYKAPPIREIFGISERKDFNRNLAAIQKKLFEAQGFSFESLSLGENERLRSLLAGDISEKAILFCRLAVSSSLNRSKIVQLKMENEKLWEEVRAWAKPKSGYLEPRLVEAKFLWRLYFAPGKACFVPMQRSAEEVVKRVHSAGGVMLYSPEGHFDEVSWSKLLALGIDGLMGWHGGNLEVGRNVIRDIKQRNLLIMGGSDYDPSVEEWQIGSGDGTMFISIRRHKELLLRLINNGHKSI